MKNIHMKTIFYSEIFTLYSLQAKFYFIVDSLYRNKMQFTNALSNYISTSTIAIEYYDEKEPAQCYSVSQFLFVHKKYIQSMEYFSAG